jgi:predicted TPR repeat methyltransferase
LHSIIAALRIGRMKNFPVSSDAGTSDAFTASSDLEALMPREMIPLVAAGRWAELLTITEARIASPDATATDWHAHGTALLGLRRFAEGGAALDYAKQCGPGASTTQRPSTTNVWVADALELAARGQGEAAIRRLAFRLANMAPVSDGFLEAMAVRRPSSVRLTFTAEELLTLARVLGHNDIAASLATGWKAITPGSASARYMHAAICGEMVPPAAPADYVREQFDGFAASFEKVLVDGLGYGTPAVMRDALEAWMRAQPALLRILDLGCGTGLSGPLFRPFAIHLAGVDLAPRMLAIATEKGCYDQLDVGEITEFLRAAAAGPPHDLIIATDVVMYFGEIAALLEAVSGALRSGGRFSFTVEAHDLPGQQLYPTGRYKHQRSWVERQAAQAGFEVIAVEKTIIRMEAGEPVAGWLFLIERPHAA